MKIWIKDNRKKLTEYLFYLALTIELVLMLVEKSELTFSYESYVFRVTFLLTLGAVVVMEHDWREWLVIAVILAVSAYSYIHSGRNDLLRLSLLLMACRDIDLRKAMKYCFFVSVTGFAVIALLSVFGILGDVYLIGDFGRQVVDEKRYVFGFGHPNTLFGSVYAALLMWIWLYGEKAGWIGYTLAVAISGVATVVTRSRTGGIICILTIFLAVISRLFNKLQGHTWPYVLGTIAGPITSVTLSVLAAYLAGVAYIDERSSPKFWELEAKIGYRMSNIYYSAEDRGAVLYRWKLFAGHGADSYFDMGWVRLFYWYGVIPAVLIILAVFAVIIASRKLCDIWAMIIIISVSIYTIVEATFVTRYLGRDFFLLIGGVYLGYFFRTILFGIDSKEGKTNVGQA